MSDQKCGCRIVTVLTARDPFSHSREEIVHCPRHSEETAKERDRLKLYLDAAIDALIVNNVSVPDQFRGLGEIARLMTERDRLLAAAQQMDVALDSTLTTMWLTPESPRWVLKEAIRAALSTPPAKTEGQP